MTTEQQCLAMARDQGEIIPNNNWKFLTYKYTTREAVVNAIVERCAEHKEFQFKIDANIKEIVLSEKSEAPFLGSILVITSALREAYLRARGLWVKENEKQNPEDELLHHVKDIVKAHLEDEISNENINHVSENIINFLKARTNFFKKEEVVFPTLEDLYNKPLSHMTRLDEFISIFESGLDRPKRTQFRRLLKSIIAEARRQQ